MTALRSVRRVCWPRPPRRVAVHALHELPRRDHVKAIFAKVGVNSRGELVARLFADHYEPVHLQDVIRQP